ncbi:diguanylate cyclase [Paucibacter sp. APW11]|uniref:Diguanylate cyclase n=1 Tax=Roseateles aquae TaxID=3077235 RepID=A0ABU3PEW7_9BURK|nr:diguanylate cyclase [Paucibacter sp. APW11]MDT9001104.1 diguanylate cyclase [Paucibacter sp. APW11]
MSMARPAFARCCAPASPLAGARLRLAPLLLGLVLQGCSPPPESKAPTAASAVLPAQPRDQALWVELEKIERLLSAKPEESEQQLRELQERSRPGSEERLEILGLRLSAAAQSREQERFQTLLKQLQDWPANTLRPAARLVASCAQARLLKYQADLRAAARMLADLPSFSEATVPLLPLLRAYNLLSTLQADMGNVDEAIENGLRAERLAERSGALWRHADALNALAWFYQRADQLERAQQLSNEALAEALRDAGPMLLYSVYNSRAILFSDEPDKRIAQEAYEAAMNYARQSGGVGVLALALGNTADFHLRLGNPAKALQYAAQALPLARQAKDIASEILALHNQGIAKIALKRVEEGKQDVRRAIAMDEQQGALRYAADGWEELGQYLEKAGDYAGAIEADLQYRALIDRVLRDETRKTVLEAQERYDDERRAKEIDLLNRGNSLKAEQIRARDLALKLWLALGGCIILSATLLAMAYRRIRRTNLALASSNESLKLQSERDPLTGLANRRFFQTAIRRLADSGRLRGTMFLIDIDHFKRINDQYGHAAGDTVLVEVSRRLRTTLREHDLIVRWGGEEFLIVIGAEEADYAAQLAKRLLEQISSPEIRHGEQVIPVSASIGYASFPLPPHGIDVQWERAIDVVDTLMYIAKAHGRNKAYGLERSEARSEAELLALTERMESAWHEGQVVLASVQGPPLGGSF